MAKSLVISIALFFALTEVLFSNNWCSAGPSAASLARSVERLEGEMARLTEENKEMKSTIESLQASVTALAQSATPAIAFSATIAEEDSNEYTESQIIRFRIVLSNFGDAFDASTYKFTAPVKGIYMFYVNNLSDYDSAGSMALFRYTGGAEYLQTRSWTRTEINVMSNMVIIQCEAGDQVYVRQYYSGTTRLHELYGGTYNMFTGALITILP